MLLPKREGKSYFLQQEAFQKEAKVEVGNSVHDAVSAGPFAQQILVPSGTITAVNLAVRPRADQSGWMRLDLHADEQDVPGRLLARSWMRISKKHGVRAIHGVMFDLPDTRVKPGVKAWLVFIDFHDQGGHTSLSQYFFANSKDPEPGMALWRHGVRPKPRTGDMVFQVYNRSPESHASYREATEEEIESLEKLEINPRIIPRCKWMR